jgi:CBS domain-containing protein
LSQIKVAYPAWPNVSTARRKFGQGEGGATMTVKHLLEQKGQNLWRHLPVLEGKKVIGIVSIGDLLKAIISKQKFVIDELEHYIRG